MPNYEDSADHPVLTTHSTWGAGQPRLLVSNGDERFTFALTEDVVQIGSDTNNQLVLSGAAGVHATVNHDDRDEYVLTLLAPGETNANLSTVENVSGGNSEILRSGAHFTLSGWRLVFEREEFADHGRPHGGREGGEMNNQQPQPARPDYQSEHAASDPRTAAHDSTGTQERSTGRLEHHLEVKE